MAKQRRTPTRSKPKLKAVARNGNVLDISTTDFERPTVRIDGRDFKLRVPDELTFKQFAEQQKIGKRFTELGAGDVEIDDMLDEAAELTARQARLLLIDVPDEVIEKLTPGLMTRIQHFFNQLAPGKSAPAASKTGSKPSPGASDSTAASGA